MDATPLAEAEAALSRIEVAGAMQDERLLVLKSMLDALGGAAEKKEHGRRTSGEGPTFFEERLMEAGRKRGSITGKVTREQRGR